jgi:hypothetical protein
MSVLFLHPFSLFILLIKRYSLMLRLCLLIHRSLFAILADISSIWIKPSHFLDGFNFMEQIITNEMAFFILSIYLFISVIYPIILSLHNCTLASFFFMHVYVVQKTRSWKFLFISCDLTLALTFPLHGIVVLIHGIRLLSLSKQFLGMLFKEVKMRMGESRLLLRIGVAIVLFEFKK